MAGLPCCRLDCDRALQVTCAARPVTSTSKVDRPPTRPAHEVQSAIDAVPSSAAARCASRRQRSPTPRSWTAGVHSKASTCSIPFSSRSACPPGAQLHVAHRQGAALLLHPGLHRVEARRRRGPSTVRFRVPVRSDVLVHQTREHRATATSSAARTCRFVRALLPGEVPRASHCMVWWPRRPPAAEHCAGKIAHADRPVSASPPPLAACQCCSPGRSVVSVERGLSGGL